MKFLLIAATILLVACNNGGTQKESTKPFSSVLDNYYEERLRLFPLEATQNGDNRYNDQLNIDFTNTFRDSLTSFYNKYLHEANTYKRETLNATDQLSYDVFKREMELNIEGLAFTDNYIPFQQFWGLPLTMGQYGSGDGVQPFKTVKDYENWLSRASKFGQWTDSAIVYFRKGVEKNYVLPKSLVAQMIPQMESMVVSNDSASLFYGPIKNIPATFLQADKDRLRQAYTGLIHNQLVPAYKRLADFLRNEYFDKARLTSGIGSLPGGAQYYQYLIRTQTTTNQTPDEIYQTGLKEVERLRRLQDSVKNAVGFKGDLQAFFDFMRSDKQFTPYKNPAEVLAAFDSIHKRIQPNLSKMFNRTPKTPFEIRQTEAYRAATASAEYNQGSANGSRPGIFYVPILNAADFNTTSGMESLFLHEAIPGHHYQISLQQEDTTLPKFRRFGGNNAYVEGWALYCESLGKELGLYTDPYQYMAALGDEIHRAIRLVVDVAIHTKNMSREEAIKYMMSNEAANTQYATMEIERYMAIPGQALGYKIGSLKIAGLRNKYQQQLGNAFNLAAFHDEVLKDGALPLDVLERKMDLWALGLKK